MTNSQERHKRAKASIRYFLGQNYTDERLAQLLAHSQDGRLAFNSCCCFIGIPTMDHSAMCGHGHTATLHHLAAGKLPGAARAEQGFNVLWHSVFTMDLFAQSQKQDVIRRRILIPMVRAEMRRRDRKSIAERAAAVPSSDIAAALVSAHMVAK